MTVVLGSPKDGQTCPWAEQEIFLLERFVEYREALSPPRLPSKLFWGWRACYFSISVS